LFIEGSLTSKKKRPQYFVVHQFSFPETILAPSETSAAAAASATAATPKNLLARNVFWLLNRLKTCQLKINIFVPVVVVALHLKKVDHETIRVQ